jgi:tetratricopeptide (TPR) repeat protein
MQNIQNRIDRLVTNGNNEFSEQRNVIAALVEYSRCLDLFDFIDRSYKIQYHEILVRIAICYDILGNFNKTIEYLNKSLGVINNVSSLVLYKSVLLQTVGKNDEAQKILIKYKQISGKRQIELYETFRLVFFYTMQLEKEVLLVEINEFLSKYSKNAVILYLRAMIYLDYSNSKKQRENDYYMKYENDLKEAIQLEPTDTEYLIKDGITNENLTKLFFMILPDMDFYQPRPLVNYYTFHSGFKLFYILFKAIKMLRIKVEKKKLKKIYHVKLKQFKNKTEKGDSESSSNSLVNEQNGGTAVDSSKCGY